MVVALLQVMSVVRGLCKRGITICATIHCPPPHTFTLFDRSLIMQRGRTAYFGLNGQPAIDYFYSHFDKVGPGSTHAPVQCLALTDEQGRFLSDVILIYSKQCHIGHEYPAFSDDHV